MNGQTYASIPYGMHYPLIKRQPLSSGGEIRGFDVLSYFSGIADSWLCSTIETDMFDLYGIRPNQYGLIDTHEQAMNVHHWLLENEGRRAEPDPHYPWLIVQYPLAENSL